jgi:hypothetical protein
LGRGRATALTAYREFGNSQDRGHHWENREMTGNGPVRTPDNFLSPLALKSGRPNVGPLFTVDPSFPKNQVPTRPAGRARVAYFFFGAFVPYFDRPCRRLSTPFVSRAPRMM